jgi:hypothetical protein
MMERAAFEQARDQLDAILAPRKFRLAQEVYNHASFGSKLAVWSRRGGSMRLVWDGREDMLLLEVQADEIWEALFVGTASDAAQVAAAAERHLA